MVGIGIKSELRHDDNGSADILQRAVDHSVLVLEYAEDGNPFGNLVGNGLVVIWRDTKKHEIPISNS